MIWLASKMVGRWPSGAPLVLTRRTATTRRARRHDAFEYGGDPDGLACPIGAHIRRTHPRDDLKPYPAEQSRHMSEAHRLLRRARVFGPPLFDPATSFAARVAARSAMPSLSLDDDGEARGIHFFCVNASIRSQFEFVQQTWCNNPRSAGSPATRIRSSAITRATGEPPTRMTIPGAGGNCRTAPLPRFVTVRGGRLSVHAEPHGAAVSRGRLVRARLDRLNS